MHSALLSARGVQGCHDASLIKNGSVVQASSACSLSVCYRAFKFPVLMVSFAVQLRNAVFSSNLMILIQR